MATRFLARPLPTAMALLSVFAIDATSRAQQPGWGPTASVNRPAPSATWPAQPPARIYVLPFPMEPGLEQQLKRRIVAQHVAHLHREASFLCLQTHRFEFVMLQRPRLIQMHMLARLNAASRHFA